MQSLSTDKALVLSLCMTCRGLVVKEDPVTWLLPSPRSQAFSTWWSEKVTPILFPTVFEQPQGCLGCQCGTRRSLYETQEKLQAPHLDLLHVVWRVSPRLLLRIGLSSALLLCRFSSNHHPWEWDALKNTILNYKPVYGWKRPHWSPSDGVGVVFLLGLFQSLCLLNFSKRQDAFSQKEICGRF